MLTTAGWSALVSDVHLCEERPAQVEAFIGLLGAGLRGCHALYILGDLFEYWIGDDECDAALPARVLAALRALHEAGTPCFLLHGNRDFLIGEEFARRASLQLLDDPVCVDLEGTPTILMHGDLLCTDDVAYLAFRTQVREPAWQQDFLAQPLALRHRIAHGATEQSGRAKAVKSEQIMDVTATAVSEVFQRFGARRLIHGHTHRPGYHQHLVDGAPCERWVLPDWYGSGGWLRVDTDGVHAEAA